MCEQGTSPECVLASDFGHENLPRLHEKQEEVKGSSLAVKNSGSAVVYGLVAERDEGGGAELVVVVLRSEDLRNLSREWKQGVEAVLTTLFIVPERWGDDRPRKRS
jgi:hypothetical protein